MRGVGMEEPIIAVNNLTKRFKSRGNKNLLTGLWDPRWKYKEAVKNVSFKVRKGEAVAFLGPNGAGKTTTTKMMCGLVYPTRGDIRVMGYTPFDRKPAYLRRIGLVMGNKASLDWDLTANQSFWLLSNIYSVDERIAKQRKKELAEMLDVADKLDLQVRRLSLGERMKLELIAAILHSPDVLFLDEPTLGLDIESKNNVRIFLRDLQQCHAITMVLTSHDMDDVEKVCDRVLVINEGSIVHDGPISELDKRYNRNKYVRFHFKNPIVLEELRQLGKVVDTANGYLMRVPRQDLMKLLSQVAERYEVDDINIESIPLETIIGDIFRTSRQKLHHK